MKKLTGGIILVQDKLRLASSIIPSTSEGVFITKESRHKPMRQERKVKAFYYSIRNILRRKCSWSLQGPVAFKAWKQKAAYTIRKHCQNNYIVIS